MKRRTFLSLAGWTAALGLPLAGKAAQNLSPSGSTASVLDDQSLKVQNHRGIIKVLGVGGAGKNVVEQMIHNGVPGLDLVCMDTDSPAPALNPSRDCDIPRFLRDLPGRLVEREPEAGRQWALSIRSSIAEVLKGAQMVFITAGMGGETGTGAAPVVAEVARDFGVRTVAMVTMPFAFEGRRVRRAPKGLLDLGQSVDALIVLVNENLTKVTGGDISLFEFFRCADDIMKNVIVGIAENINELARTGTNFEDARIVTVAFNKTMIDPDTAFGIGRVIDKDGKEITFPLAGVLEIHSLPKVLSA